MSLGVGDVAPDFALADQSGQRQSLTELLTAGPVVLFFYPAAASPVCTKEACHFRDLGDDFAALGAQRVGISKDAVLKQANFASAQGLDYPVLSDTQGETAAAYGVKAALFGKVGPLQRTTFTIGTDRRILHVTEGLLKAEAHADEALTVLRAL